MLTKIARNALFRLDPETAHRMTISALIAGQTAGIIPGCDGKDRPELSVKIAGLKFPNPVGLAAGFDKNGQVATAMLQLGFGFVEIGTVTPLPQSGNPRPRIFRLPSDHAVINRLGFNNNGHDQVINNLSPHLKNRHIIGVNIGANKDSSNFIADYERGIEKFYSCASYFAANISSPNTPGLRDLQTGRALQQLLSHITDKQEELRIKFKKTVPVFLKIAPDLSEASIDEIAYQINASNIDGLIVSNTTTSRAGLRENIVENGGLSGRPLFKNSTVVLAKMRQRLGDQFPIIGVGGIDSAQAAWEKLEAGANLVQLYTGMIYQGPRIAGTICRGLAEKLAASRWSSINEVTGANIAHWSSQELQSG